MRFSLIRLADALHPTACAVLPNTMVPTRRSSPSRLPEKIISLSPASPRATPPIGTQLAELKVPGALVDYGASVAVSGQTAIVGAPGLGNTPGRAYVFTKTAAGWTQTAELNGSGAVNGGQFGTSVAISGKTVIVGEWSRSIASGRAYVFTKTATGWDQTAELKAPSDIGPFGSLAISGMTAVVGSNDAAYVFTKTTAGWEQAAELEGSDTVAGDWFGGSVAISGTTAVVSADRSAKDTGRAYVFTKTAAGWTQTAELKGFDTVAGDAFGSSVAISGTTAVVGAEDHAKNTGRAYVFTKTAAGWTQTAELKGFDTVAGVRVRQHRRHLRHDRHRGRCQRRIRSRSGVRVHQVGDWMETGCRIRRAPAPAEASASRWQSRAQP